MGTFFLGVQGPKQFQVALYFEYNSGSSDFHWFCFSFPNDEPLSISQLNVDENVITKVDMVGAPDDSILFASVKVSRPVPLPILMKSALPLALQLYEKKVGRFVRIISDEQPKLAMSLPHASMDLTQSKPLISWCSKVF